jgi:hypothetical protein
LSWLFISLFLIFSVYHGYYKNNYQSHYLAQGYQAPGETPDDDYSDEEDDLQTFIRG